MRILKIEFENLNSLKGRWSVDFTHPDYQKNHDIFVIHGTTGAGKTTILDAIALALYGRTPRQPAVNDGAGGNELMTRGTASCYSKVTYRCKKGIFISEFQQGRARGKTSGRLQKANYRITTEAGEVIAVSGSGSSLEEATREIIQLDYNQFCRSIMLAQGEFNKFLTSDERARADILEKLTGTERYREIAQKICQKFSTVKKAFSEKKAEKDEIESLILSDDEEKAALKNENELEKSLSENEEKLDALRTELAFYDELERLFREFELANAEKERIEKETADFAGGEVRLTLAQAAKNCEAEFISLENLRKSQEDDSVQIQALGTQIEKSAEAFEHACKRSEEMKRQLADEEKDFADQQKIWKKVRELDVQTENARTRKNEAEEGFKSAEADFKAADSKAAALGEGLRQLEAELLETRAYLEQNKADEQLPAVIARAETLLSGAVAQEKAAGELKEKQAAVAARQAEVQTRLGEARAELEAADEEIKRFVSADAVMIARLLRGQLAEGNPCPVCGALYHAGSGIHVGRGADCLQGELDFSGGDDSAREPPPPDEKAAEIVRESSSLTYRHEELSVRVQELGATLDSLAGDLRNAEENLAAALTSRDEQLSLITEALRPWTPPAQSAASALSPALCTAAAAKGAGMGTNTESGAELRLTTENIPALLGALRERFAEWTRRESSFRRAESEKSARSVELSALAQTASARKSAMDNAAARLSADSAAFNELLSRRQELFGGKDPEREEALKNQQILRLRAACEECAAAQSRTKEEKARLEAQKTQLESAVAARTPSLHSASEAFSARLSANAFADEAAFCAARLPEAELSSLREKSESLKTRRTQADTSLKNARKSYEDYKSSFKTRRTKEEALAEQTQITMHKNRLNAELIEVKSRLQTNIQNKRRAEKLMEEYVLLRGEYETWEQMKKWVGKDDGSDFSVFVQSLAFRRLLDITNSNLFGITRRYRIVQKSPLSLDFEINDVNFPENRSIKTLSGGEQFIVSLSLALGISRFASRNVSVDSLFLDEGFGTLSGELLDEAVSALKNLQKEHKMLGIITHVQEVINEIDQRIEVRPVGGGHSVLVGSGITQGA